MHQYNFTNRTAIVTGGAQGFGLDIAKKFLKFGASKVIIWDIDEDELKKASKEVNNSKLFYDMPIHPPTQVLGLIPPPPPVHGGVVVVVYLL